MTRGRSAGVALLLLFLAAHLAFLPRTLEDLDSINFALGVRQFDVAKHQPHPPGYPVYIALAKASTASLRAAGIEAASPRGLAIWSAIGGAAAIPAILLFFRRLEGRDALARWATALAAVSPLFWFSAWRPLSDMPGLAAAMWALALMAGQSSRRDLAMGSLIAGLAVGLRSQTAVLTFPFLVYTLLRRRDVRDAGAAIGALAVGGIAWAIPLFVVSGGVAAYLQALGSQAGADLGGGVVMLWTHRSARVAAQALINTFVWPWDWWPGIAVTVLAAIGSLRLAWRSLPAAVTLFIAFVPYAVFHLLFHETVTTRYALPLIPVVAYVAMAALEGLPGRAMPAAVLGFGAISLMGAMPAGRHYAKDGAPAFRAFDDMAATAHGGDRVDAIAFHAGLRRAVEWAEQILPAAAVKAPHGHEWLPLVELWRTRPAARVWFAADPKRTDLELFDPRARELARAYRWEFVEPPYVGGARPGNVDWFTMEPPNWMLDRGWSVTPEVAGITATERVGPHIGPVVAWLKRQSEPVTIVLGGRNVGASPRTLEIALNGAHLSDVPAQHGFFVTRLDLPAGSLAAGPSYLPLEVRAGAGDPVTLEQFDAQPAGVPMLAFEAGWQEPEYNPETGLSWRWMSERADLWIRPVGRAVTLHLSGESPRKYYDAPPSLRVSAGGRDLAAFEPSADFDYTVTLPADVLASANGVVTITSSRFFVPAQRSGAADQRHLALRIYRVTLE